MQDNDFKALMSALSGEEKRPQPAKIMALPAEQKANALAYLIKKKRPIIALFVSDAYKDVVTEAGYLPGYHNDHYDYWIQPDQKRIFQQYPPDQNDQQQLTEVTVDVSVQSTPKEPNQEVIIKPPAQSAPVKSANGFANEFNRHPHPIPSLDTLPPVTTRPRRLSNDNAVPKMVNIADREEYRASDTEKITEALIQSPNKEPGQLGDADYYRKYRKMLFDSELSLTDEIEEPTVCLEIESNDGPITLGTLGNFSLIVGKAKSRKTFLLSVLVAALVKRSVVMDKVRGQLPTEKLKILYFDTEQHKGHVKRVLRRIATLAGIESLPDIRVFHLKRFAPNDRLNAIRVAIEDTLNLGGIVIDGIRDTVFDINDAREATERATDLLQWTEDKGAHLITVIHENKGNSNARGHLGSELVNKAETVVSVGRDPNDKSISIVTPEYCRDKEFDPFGFAINEQGLPYLTDALLVGNSSPKRTRKPTVDTMSTDDITAIVRRAFSNDKQLRYAQLRVNIMEASEFVGITLAKTRAESFIQRVELKGCVIKFKPPNQRYDFYEINADMLSD